MKKFEPNQSGGCYKNVCVEDPNVVCPRRRINAIIIDGKYRCREDCMNRKLRYTEYNFIDEENEK